MLAAPIDSAAVAGALATGAATWLNSTFPGMDPENLAKISNTLGSLPIMAAIFIWEMGVKLIGKWLPGVGLTLGPFWSRYKILLNPALGLVLGTAGGNPVLGLIASGLWSAGGGVVKVVGGTNTVAGRARAGMGVVLALLLLPSVASAATPYAVGPFPFVFQGGVGARLAAQAVPAGQKAQPYGWVHVTFPVRDHWVLRTRLEQPLQRSKETDKLGKMDLKAEVGFSFP